MTPEGKPLEYSRVTETVTTPVPNQYGIVDSATGQTCFYCGAILSDPAIHWNGWTGDVYLHKPCALDLAVRVLRDVHEIENPRYYERLRGHRDDGA